MDPWTVLESTLLVGVAELGDKSQLVCLALAARHRPSAVILAAAAAFGVLGAVGVAVGSWAAAWLPLAAVRYGAAALFAVFGVVLLWRPGEDDDEAVVEEGSGRSAFAEAFGLLFLAELGDKTQLETVALGALRSPLEVWLGATLGLTLSAVVAVVLGRALGQRLDPRRTRRLAGVLFLAFAVWTVLST